MRLDDVTYVASYGTADQLPESSLPEVSFVGRSNVGKSSIMNKLFGRKDLVRVSSKPGKTTLVSFFRAAGIDFVDLPGYGYAKRSQAERDRWAALIDGYFEQDRRHALVVSLVDIRHDASALDLQMIDYLCAHDLPFCIAFTKADKLSRAQQDRQVASICRQIAKMGDAVEDVPIVVCSAVDGTGTDDLLDLIGQAAEQV
ncbi:MAG: ribosome biogenesis GTP-binding protein YihA/YsxC [Atopobiaceae bacterium]|jgi:GTP-binding protein|nr:ribosome biogenesis GTP-binding protein YihA/YsxC [Atopobiaceae bacterium]MCI2174206.1 ribosome biogenesis GTP-binding protein YihA/YsxC [Atopobiaceae bacterium]MCI2206847.1 ribosome biogenesis GTP-binding protein YihA/YsxC [Atopobiaceae bacterium]